MKRVWAWLKRRFGRRQAATVTPLSGGTGLQGDPRSSLIDLGDGRIACYEWGDPDAKDVVFCVHGLTRNARDFDFLATDLARDRRVIAIDVVGRGQSSWLSVPSGYLYPLYVDHAIRVLQTLNVGPVDWIGTSMGGIIGMMVAARKPALMRRLVLNDVGAEVSKEALRRILNYVGDAPRFADEAEAEAYFRRILVPFGPLEPRHWSHIVQHCTRPLGQDGSLTTHYDPKIAVPLAGADKQDVNLWPLWTAVTHPVLLLRGAESDLLTAATAEAMTGRGRVELVEFAGIGHAPSLMVADQISVVRRWLDA